MNKGNVEMLDAEKDVPASDVLVSKESTVKYENGVKTGKSNAEDQLNSKSQPEAHDNVVLENKTPTIDAGTYDMVSGYLKLTIDEGEMIKVHQKLASPMFLINPSTVNAGEHSGEASENIFAVMADCEHDEGSLKDQAAFLGKLGTFYREKA
ncbi:hypothetical protein H5410_061708 [Solanum commersonii]|uniref:Uncharacterized protein n=1 Tax=Solanum commersonii TaxID=4109 RepID=A0A9J5WAF7_SOLCO|nr:hypothetical protein H5410_061708 [Solanum commersonii]